jgi:hypothetical protein
MRSSRKHGFRIQNYLVSLVMLGLLLSSPASAGYEISWYSIDGGGGMSSGGSYELIGTIGQPDAANSSGGSYEVRGGFWPGGPMCFVDFEHYARFAQFWRDSGAEMPADLYEDGQVNWYDVSEFGYWWLYECPSQWPLK